MQPNRGNRPVHGTTQVLWSLECRIVIYCFFYHSFCYLFMGDSTCGEQKAIFFEKEKCTTECLLYSRSEQFRETLQGEMHYGTANKITLTQLLFSVGSQNVNIPLESHNFIIQAFEVSSLQTHLPHVQQLTEAKVCWYNNKCMCIMSALFFFTKRQKHERSSFDFIQRMISHLCMERQHKV